MCVSLSVASFVTLTAPGMDVFSNMDFPYERRGYVCRCCDSLFSFLSVSIGRTVMSQWMGETSVHELYTAACGLYIGWVVCRILAVLLSWVPLGLSGVAKKFLEWVMLVLSFCNSAIQRPFRKSRFLQSIWQKPFGCHS